MKMKAPKKLKHRREKKRKEPTGKIYNAFTWTIQAVVEIVIAYIVSVYTAVSILPLLCGTLISSMGITLETATMDLFALWILPVGFLTLMIFVAEILLYWLLWKWLCRIFGKMREQHLKEIKDGRKAE